VARKTYEELKDLQKKFNTTRLWSFSRINAYLNCSYSYFLKYVKREKERESGIYGILGGIFHDILEDFYRGKSTYEEMIENAENKILEVNLMDLKFNKNDAEKNEGIEKKYFACIKHFFANHVPVEFKVLCEKFITIKIGNHYFQGYIDAIHKDGKDFIITDYKSSTIYTGKKIPKEGKQLMLYALGLHQQGIPVENIKIRWNFLKYTSVTFMQKNGKEKTMHAERWAWVGKIKSKLRMNLKDAKLYKEDEIEEMLEEATQANNLNNMPDHIQKLYKLEDCYVYIPIDPEILKDFENEFNNVIIRIYRAEKDYEDTKDIEKWKRVVDQGCLYFCSNICGYTASQCQCYKEFLENEDSFKLPKYKKKTEDDDKKDWLEELGLI